MPGELLPRSFTAAMMGAAMADVPGVAVDMAPVHSPVAPVTKGIGAPNLIVRAPHEHTPRPCGEAALQGTDLVFWTADAVMNLVGNAAIAMRPEAEDAAGLACRHQSIPDGWTHATHRPRPPFARPLSCMPRPESQVSA